MWRGTDYAGLEWLDPVQTKPTEAEIAAQVIVLDAAAAAETTRVASYNSDAPTSNLYNMLKTSTPAQIDTWLLNNVTTLSQARTVLGMILKFMVAHKMLP